jgi:hypothetical protein
MMFPRAVAKFLIMTNELHDASVDKFSRQQPSMELLRFCILHVVVIHCFFHRPHSLQKQNHAWAPQSGHMSELQKNQLVIIKEWLNLHLSLQIIFVELHDELDEIFHDFVLVKISTCAKHIRSFIQENSKHRAPSPAPPHLDLYQCLSHTTNVNNSFPIPTPKQEKLDNIKWGNFKCHHLGQSLWFVNQKQTFSRIGPFKDHIIMHIFTNPNFIPFISYISSKLLYVNSLYCS